jgi:hypothetical protein
MLITELKSLDYSRENLQLSRQDCWMIDVLSNDYSGLGRVKKEVPGFQVKFLGGNPNI